MSGAASSSLFEQTGRWFERARAALVAALPCRRGCHRCCIGLFPITLLDRWTIQQGLRALPPDRRTVVVRRATHQAAAIAAAAPSLVQTPFIDGWQDRDLDDLAARFADLPCPALDDEGSCGLYEFRPLACRSMGIPVEQDGIVQGACELQTFVPVRTLSSALRREEDRLAEREAQEVVRMRRETQAAGEELLLPYGFLPTLRPSPRQRL